MHRQGRRRLPVLDHRLPEERQALVERERRVGRASGLVRDARRGEPLVASDSRTGRVAVFASADEHAEITRERGVRLIEPLGAACEPWPTP